MKSQEKSSSNSKSIVKKKERPMSLMIKKIMKINTQFSAKLTTQSQHNYLLDHVIVVSKPKAPRNSKPTRTQRQKVTITPPKKPINGENREKV